MSLSPSILHLRIYACARRVAHEMRSMAVEAFSRAVASLKLPRTTTVGKKVWRIVKIRSHVLVFPSCRALGRE